VVDLLAEKAGVFPSKGEAKKMIAGGGVAINKAKVSGTDAVFSTSDLVNGKYLIAQKGKKNYFLIIIK
jgi:tyrosyl-tRNA synthetase